MTDIQDMGRYKAEGYSFFTEKDAALAENERRKVEYLEAHLDYNQPESILRIYKKAIEDRVFKSPVGLLFLKNLQMYLLNQQEINHEDVDAIPLYVSFEGEFRETPNPARSRVKREESKPKKKSVALAVSIISNIGLVVAVIAMFAVALNADQPNILNYEQVLQNKYASWEQELTEREQEIRQKELELQINLSEE